MHYAKAIGVFEQLRIEDPSRISYSAELAKILQNVAVIYNVKKEYEGATREIKRAIRIQEELLDEAPSDHNLSREFARSLTTLANNLYDSENYNEAVTHYRRSRDIHRQLVDQFPDQYDYTNGLAFSLSGLGRCEWRLSEIAESIKSLQEAVKVRKAMDSLSPSTMFDLASNLALLTRLSQEQTTGLTPENAAAFTRESIDYLKQAIESGFNDTENIKDDPNFEALQQNEEFKKVLSSKDAVQH